MTSDLVPSSSTTTQQPKQRCYDVFLSFRGEDTRDNFVSHLHKTLSDHHIKTFIDYNLQKGDDFPPALLASIEESLISLVIFSENYADSTWCLRELAKIMECKNSIHKQIVVPVFYKVDPSHVRNQIGKFGAAFHRLQERLKGKMDFDEARSHLMEAAIISGWDSQVTRPESQLITGIVGDVLNKLNLESFSCSTNLVGIFSHIEKVESLLCLDTLDVSIVGVWGMGGIGKSTIARAVFNYICKKFDVFHFLPNVHDELKKRSLYNVRDMLLQKIFEKECQSMGTHNLRPDFIRRQLQQKKVLIVFDDVSDVMELKELLGGQDYFFGSGSKILVTSRDKQVLKSVTSKIYDVREMDGVDALKLFSLNAFKQNHPTNDYQHLSRRALNYAKGNPLALVVLGSALFDRSKDEWVSAFEGLEKEPNINIQNVLRISYNPLSSEEQKIFLDISCFLCGSHQDFVNEYYGISVLFKIKNLQDKSFITISSSNIIEMHDLLKYMGRSIDQEEYSHKLEKRERLWTPVDIRIVLTKKTGTAKIKAISLGMSGIKEMYLDSDVFGGMESLQYLKFYDEHKHYENRVYFKGNGGVDYLPGGLRYFHWDGFPAKHLPSNFCAENLVELRLDGSKVTELWTGVQDLRNLRVISLSGCSNLIEIPDLSEAKNLRRINLSRCRNVPSLFVSEALEYLDLSSCSNLRRIPDISSMSTLKLLNLSDTDIEEVPSSIESLSRLETLNMSCCRRLSTISTNICKLKYLVDLCFYGCVRLESFPEMLEPLEQLNYIELSGCVSLKTFSGSVPSLFVSEALEYLDLSSCSNLRRIPDILSMSTLTYLNLRGTDIEEAPSSIESLSRLEILNMSDCRRLSTISTNICKLKYLVDLLFQGCVRLESFPEMLEPLEHLVVILLGGCVNLKTFPGDWYNLKSLQDLNLSGTSITEVLPMYVGGTRLANLTCCSGRCNSNTKKITYVEGIEEIRPHLPLPGRGIKEPPPPGVQFLPYSSPIASIIKRLYLNRCPSLSMLSFANAIPSFSSLRSLHLNENNWESLPGNMDRLSNLENLYVNDCKNLRSIPKLPLSLHNLEANDCESLECIHGLIRLGVECNLSILWLINCFKLEEATRYKMLEHFLFRMMIRTKPYECVLPGTELPEWMGMKMGMGSSATIKLPSSQNVEYNWSRFRGFAFSLLFSPDTTAAATEQYSSVQFQCILKYNNDHRVVSHLETSCTFKFLPVKSEQLFLWSRTFYGFKGELDLDELMGKEISFEFSTTEGGLAVNKCAVHPLFEGETVALAAVATATTKTNKPTRIRNPSKFRNSSRRKRLMIRSGSLSLRLSKTRFQRHHSASSKKRIRSFLSLHSSSYKSLKLKRRRTT